VASTADTGRAEVVGTGLIGGSLGLALRARGWYVTGWDRDAARAGRAAEVGALDEVGVDPSAAITFVATPAGAVVDVARGLLDGHRVVTDVAGIKGPIVESLPEERFVGGHPMAGSEQEGVDGADANLFEGATWVLTPTETTDPQAYATVQTVVRSLGASVVAVAPRRHDDLVAMVSHVPHLAAATLMNLAADTALEHATLLRLAAGGFRDMTRISAGHPGIWPDVCTDNRDAILAVLDQLLGSLGTVRDIVAKGDRDGLLTLLERARQARQNLPVGAPPPSETVEIRVPVPDRPAVLAEVTTLLGELGVNIYDFEIAHSTEGEGGGVIIMVVAASAVPVVREVLTARGYRVSARRLSA
jgi:prephenate dehydrogenase